MVFRKHIIWFVFGLCPLMGFAQRTAVGQWRDHYSYNNVFSIVPVGNEICGATENGLFFYDKRENSIRRKTTIQGLSSVRLTASSYDPSTQIQVVGYENGNIDLILQNGRVINIPDIFRWQTTGSKRINKIIIESSERAYLCCDFGIVMLNLRQRQISENYFIGPNNSHVEVYDLAFGDLSLGDSSVYAATHIGLLRAANRFSRLLVADTSWHEIPIRLQTEQALKSVNFWNENLIVHQLGFTDENDVTHNDIIWRRDSENQWHILDSERTNQIKVSKNRLFQLRKIPDVAWLWEVWEYDSDFQVLHRYRGEDHNVLWGLEDIEVDSEHNIWISTGSHGLSRLTPDWKHAGNIIPRGPASNSVYSLTHSPTTLYSANGAVITANWVPGRQTLSVDILQNGNWRVFDYRSVSSVRLTDAVAVAENPRNPNEFVVASWEYGVLQRNADGTAKIYNAFEGSEGDFSRCGEVKFDKKNNLWTTTAFSERQLHKRSPSSDDWIAYDLGHVIPNAINKNPREFIVDYYDQLWIRIGFGILLFFREADNPAGFEVLRANLKDQNGQQVTDLNCLVEDKKGYIWLGTSRGILINRTSRQLFNNPNGLESTVVFLTINHAGRPLLENESVTAIAVDGADRKWIGTASSGVFLVSATGTELIHQFNMQNSPLNSNTITALAINPQTGDVYIGTDKGLMSFGGDATEGSRDKQKIVIFPNPVRADFTGEIGIQGLVNNAQVHITDASGRLVFQGVANGGMITWNGATRNGQRVNPGVYLVFASNDDGSVGNVGKIFIGK
jgi:ligand-binding sensor domain-containing protein